MNGMKQCFEYDQRGNGHLGETDPTPGVASASGVKETGGPCHSPLLSDGDQEKNKSILRNSYSSSQVSARAEHSVCTLTGQVASLFKHFCTLARLQLMGIARLPMNSMSSSKVDATLNSSFLGPDMMKCCIESHPMP